MTRLITSNNVEKTRKKASLGVTPVFSFLSDALFDLGALADSVTEIIELCTTNLTASDNLDLLNVRRMDRERLLDAAAICYATYLERLGNTASAATDNRTLEDLRTNSLSLFDPVIDSHGITDVELGDLCLHLLIDKHVDLGVHFSDHPFPANIETFMQSGSGPSRRTYAAHVDDYTIFFPLPQELF